MRGVDSLRHYTPEEAAEFLPVSATTLREWIRARSVPHHKLGDSASFSTEDIRTMCAMAAVAPLPELTPATDAEAAPAQPSEPATPQPGPYLTVDEAASILRCSTKWLRDGVNHSGFPHARLSRLLFTREDLERIFEMHHRPARARRLSPAAARRVQGQPARKSRALGPAVPR
ncbi:helix-turn-helix domain-containing protein [Streptomyces sp. NBC_00096]